MSDESPSNSETDENPRNVENRRKSQVEGINEYEKQRLLRIRENRAKLEAMGLPNLVSSTFASSGNVQKGTDDAKKKRAAKKKDEDDEYRPPDGEDGESSSSEVEEEDRNVRSGGSSRCGSIGKGKKISPLKTEKDKKCLPVQRHMKEMDTFDGDNDALQQAICLSLGGLPENSGANENNVHLIGRNKDANTPEATRTRKRKLNIKRVQMSEDEVIVYFFSIDEAGKGKITLRDLRRVANVHDFDWTDKEMADMIECFDSDRDGKLTLDDFQKIVARCNMIRGSENA